MEDDPDFNEVILALKYPDYHTWRDLKAAKARGGYWPDGSLVRLHDPEMKPYMDREMQRIKDNPEYARQLLNNLGLYKQKLGDNELDSSK
jgi:hypothetical protein